MGDAVASWPAALPPPTIEGYGVHPGEAIQRTEMEAGPARQRRRYTQVPSRVPVRWTMRGNQFAMFESWYRWHAKEGGEWFTIELLGGIGLSMHEARFTRPFKAIPFRGVKWEVTSELEIRERPVLREDVLAIMLDNDLTALFATIDQFHDTVHQTLPGPNVW